MTDDEKQTPKDEVMSRMNAYIATFLSGTREDAQAFVKLPVAYITETDVRMHERYPLDPEKLRQSTGLHHLNGRVEVLHISATKAHVLIEATREREERPLTGDHLYSCFILESDLQVVQANMYHQPNTDCQLTPWRMG